MTRALPLAVLLLLAVTAPAGAATVTWTTYVEPPGTPPEESCSRYAQCPPPTVTVEDGGSERNDVTIESLPDRVVVRDQASPLTAGAGCTAQPDGSVTCPPAQVFTVRAGGGDDRVATPNATVEGGDGDDTLTGFTVDGGAGNDTITGTESLNTLAGGPGTDTIDALGGDDMVVDTEPDPAPDRFDGGDGVDTLSFATRTASVRVDLGASPQVGGAAGEENQVAAFESAVGGAGADDLFGPTKAAASRIFLAGGDGNDRLFSRSPTEATLRGGAGDDELIGGPAGEMLEAEDGDDRVSGAGGNDIILGAGGSDQLDGDDGRDHLFGGEDADTLDGGEGGDRLRGDVGLDTLIGDAGNDVLRGGQGTDDLVGGVGRDRLFGGTAGDRLDGGLNADLVVGGKGRDRMSGAEGADRMRARDGERERLIDCGPDDDIAAVDRREVAVNCERVSERRARRRQG